MGILKLHQKTRFHEAARMPQSEQERSKDASHRTAVMGPIKISNTHRKAMDRIGGAALILDWPAALPRGPALARDHEREATAEEKRCAEAMVRDSCDAHGLVPVHVRVVHIARPPGLERGKEYEQHLAVTIIGRRWVRATGRHDPPDLWPSAPKDAQ